MSCGLRANFRDPGSEENEHALPFPAPVAALAVAAALALAAATAVAGKANNTLNVAFPREVVTLDGLYSNLRENDILSLVVDDVLYTVDPQTLQPVPLAALSHKVVDDRTIDVELRRGIKFHDGSELTAEDVAYSYTWTINPQQRDQLHPPHRSSGWRARRPPARTRYASS